MRDLHIKCFAILAIVFAGNAFALDVSGIPLIVQGLDASHQTQLEQKILPVLQKISAASNEIKQLNKDGELSKPSPALLDLLSLCEQWQIKTQDAFSCRLGVIEQNWKIAVEKNELPDRTMLRQNARQQLAFKWTADKQFVRFDSQAKKNGFQLNVKNLWQGWVVTQIAPIAQSLGATSFSYGKLRLQFNQDESVQAIQLQKLAPFDVSLSKGQVLTVVDRQENIRKVGHQTFSQTLIPAEGWPVEFPPSLLVRANNAIEADVMAQALLAVPASQALAIADQNSGIAALIITESDNFFASQHWYSKNISTQTPWPSTMKFFVDFDIPALDVAEYRRPYAALWISDAQGQIVRPLFVSGNNRRWLQELRQWWRKLGRNDDGVVDALAGATRKPGHYQLEWDGRNLQGQEVSQGNYVLHVEIAREHGDRENMEMPFVLNGAPVKIEQHGKRELGAVTLNLHE